MRSDDTLVSQPLLKELIVHIETVPVGTSEMEVFCFPPDQEMSSGPHPGLVLAQHIPVGHTGIENDEFTLTAARRFAAHGFYVVAPFVFHWWPKTDPIEVKRDGSRDDWTRLDLEAAFEVLKNQSGVDAGRMGIVGHCWGGRIAWLGAAHIEACRAAAIFYGGRILKSMGPVTPPAIELAADIRCPVAGFFGNDDANPSPEDVDLIDRTLSDVGVPHEFHRYDGAGHAFQNFPSPERYREAASEDAWQKVIEFFTRTLAHDQTP